MTKPFFLYTVFLLSVLYYSFFDTGFTILSMSISHSMFSVFFCMVHFFFLNGKALLELKSHCKMSFFQTESFSIFCSFTGDLKCCKLDFFYFFYFLRKAFTCL